MKKTFSSEKKDIIDLKKTTSFVFSGGGGGETPTVLQDNLVSDDFLECVLGLSEGPIVGLEKGERSFYIDATPLKSQNGSKNFHQYELSITNGDASQNEEITMKLGAETPVNVGSALGELKGYDSSDVFDTPDYDSEDCPRARYCEIDKYEDYDYIDLRFQIQQLMHTTDDGDQENGSFSFQVKWQTIGSKKWVTLPIETINGKTTVSFTKDYRIWIGSNQKNKNIRIRVVSTNNAPDQYGNQFMVYWSGVSVGKTNKKWEFKNTACAHLLIRASERINGTPKVSGIYKGLKIKIPSNYNPETHSYRGIWDGTFQIAWTDNPAWILYDILTNARYGMSSYYNFDVDKWDFYEASLFCDELVPNRFGNFVPRYTFNGILDQQKYGRDICSEIAGSFNSILYEDNSGYVRLKVYRDDDEAIHVFSKENVSEGSFIYTFTDPSNWYNEVKVTFVNAERDWIQDTRVVSDEEKISKYGRNVCDTNLIGCTNEDEAVRKAWYILLGSSTEKITVSFTTGRSGLNVNIGDVILVADPDMGFSQGRRVKEVSEDRKSIKLRTPVFLESAVIGADLKYYADFQVGKNIETYNLEVRNVGEVDTLYFDSELSENIEKYSLFTIRTNVLTKMGNPKPFRIISIEETKDSPDMISISAIEINRSKQYDADHKQMSDKIVYSSSPTIGSVPHITNLEFKEYFNKNTKTPYLDLYPTVDETAYPYYNGKYKCYWRYYGSNAWNEVDTIFVSTIENPPIGEIEWTLLPYNYLGETPPLETAPAFRYDTYDINQPPENVRNIRVEEGLTSARIIWDPVPDPDIVCYEVREGENWETGKVLTYATTNPEYTYTFNDLENHRIMVKAKDVIGSYSEIPAVTYVTAGYPENVTEFYVTPNNDYLRFDWKAIGDANVEYEVRTGNSDWGSGITLFKTKSLNQTILNPSYDYTGYLIKAVSSLGRYSERELYTEYKMELKQDRNVILNYDNTVAQPASGYIVFSQNPSAGETITIEDETLIFGTDVEIGSLLSETLFNLAQKQTSLVRFTTNEMDTINIIAVETGRVGNEISYSTTCVGAQVAGSNLTGGFEAWGGVTNGFILTNNNQTLEMNDGVSYAEHYFPIHLDKVVRARNWYETESYKYNSKLVFADLDYAWNSEEAKNTSWLNSSGVSVTEGQGIPVISWKEADRYLYDLGIPLDGQLSDVQGEVTPNRIEDVSYGPNRCAEGLVLNRVVRLDYDVNFSEAFSFRFTLRMTKRSLGFYEILRLEGENGYVDLNKKGENIIATWSDGVVQTIPFTRFSDYDFVFVQIVQTAGEEGIRRIVVATERAQHSEEVESLGAPLGSFNKLIIGSRQK